MGGSRGGGRAGGLDPPQENNKNIVFLAIPWSGSLGNHKATKPAFHMTGHHRHASLTPLKSPF